MRRTVCGFQLAPSLPQLSMFTLPPGIFDIFILTPRAKQLEIGDGELEVIAKNRSRLPIVKVYSINDYFVSANMAGGFEHVIVVLDRS